MNVRRRNSNYLYIGSLQGSGWRGVLGPTAPIACPQRSLGPVCGLRAPLALRRGRGFRSCAAPKIAISTIFILYFILENSSRTPGCTEILRILELNIILRDRASFEPRTTDSFASAQPVAEGSEAADGPEAALWTGDRRRAGPRKPRQAAAERSVQQGTDLSRINMYICQK